MTARQFTMRTIGAFLLSFALAALPALATTWPTGTGGTPGSPSGSLPTNTIAGSIITGVGPGSWAEETDFTVATSGRYVSPGWDPPDTGARTIIDCAAVDTAGVYRGLDLSGAAGFNDTSDYYLYFGASDYWRGDGRIQLSGNLSGGGYAILASYLSGAYLQTSTAVNPGITADRVGYGTDGVLIEGTSADTIELLVAHPGWVEADGDLTMTDLVVYTKTDTGDPAFNWEGLIVINTFDDEVRIYADGGWWTMASGW